MRFTVLIILIALQSVAFSQPKKYVDLPVVDMPKGSQGFSVQNALRRWLLYYPEAVRDTTVPIYIGQSIYWRGGIFHPYNLINNGDFKTTTDWRWFDNGAGGNFWADSAHNAGAVTFPVLTDNMQLYQFANAKMWPSTKYRLSFVAWSKKGSKVGVYVQKHTAPYTSYFGEVITTDATQLESRIPYSFQFTTPDSGVAVTDSQRVRFWFVGATAGDTVYFGRVALQEWYDLPEVQIAFDSVLGRGANRIANIRLTHKTHDSTFWKHGGWDTAGTVYERPTTDSTYSWSAWLAYTYDLDPNCKIHGNRFDACYGPTYHRGFQISGVPIKMEYRMIKILGDPTVNQGRDQRMLLRFRAYESVPNKLVNWVDKQSNDVIDYWNWP